eukprot:scaffold12.g8134.t1
MGMQTRTLISCRAMGSDPLHDRYAVTIGEALFDCLADQLGLSKEEVKSWTPYPGGAPANVATGVARLGARAVFIGALGRDELGEQFARLLQERGVDTSHVQRSARPTRDVLVTRSLDGDRTFAGFGKAATTEYADCFLEADGLPLDAIRGWASCELCGRERCASQGERSHVCGACWRGALRAQ